MPKMIQVRNVPDDLHRELRMRALKAGVSLSDYVLQLAREDARTPTKAEWMERVRSREPVSLGDAAALIREDRDSR